MTDDLVKASNGIYAIKSKLIKEKKNREESEKAIFDVLRDVISRVKTEIEIERKAGYFIIK